MELEQEQKVKDYNVKNLQATLFPLFPKMSGYFTSFLVKSHDTEEDDESFAKFREAGSRDLLAINRENNFQIQVARWPTECQVLPETIRHITSQPSSPELFYTKNGMEMQPKPTGDECGLIVYQYAPISAVNYFSRSSAGGSKYLLSANICPEEDTLKFESRFECGNLARAIRLTPNFYELYLRSDMYTHRYMQWFYFRVTNMKKNFLYRFSIVNFTKENSLYNDGLRPLMYSEKDSQLHSIGWKRCGDQITYYSNDNVSEESDDQHMTYTLTFTVTFPHDNDVVYFASCYPYSYSNLQEYLFELSNHPVKSTFTTLRLLCKSLAGNNVNYLTITSPQDDEVRKKRAIVLTARVHPGETPSSWMMKGIMDFLTSDCAPAKELRDKFIFKIVPMLNPDGVIVGNNRCSLSGKDLNRQYRTVIRESYPSIWYTKLMVRRLIEECGVLMYCDLHGHSRKHNMFIYGCENRRDSKQKLQEQVFPLMLHKNAAEKFSFEDCSFRVQKGREGTGRIVMWMMGITNSYTLEASFAGSTLGSRAQTLFFVQDYEQMGKTFCQTLLDFYDEEPRKERLRTKILNRLNMEGSNAEEPTNISLSDYSSDDGSSSSDSGNKLDEMSCKNEIISVPPPSPEIGDSKSKAKIVKYKQKLMKRKFDPLRKTVPMGKANLNLSLSESNFYVCSGSSSDSDDNKSSTKTKSSKKPNRRIRKKLLKKKSQSLHIQTEAHTADASTSTRSLSAFNFIVPDEFPDGHMTKRSRTPVSRIILDKKSGLDVEFDSAHKKLLALKQKIWYGIGDGDKPLSWGAFADQVDSSLPNQNSKPKRKKRNKNCKTDKGKQKTNTKQKRGKHVMNGIFCTGTSCLITPRNVI